MEFFNIYNTGDSDFVTIGKQIEMIANVKPDQTAIIEIDNDDLESEKLTWKELHMGANRISQLLKAKGIGKDDVVAVALPNGVNHILCAIAIWRIGACYLPICWHTTLELESIRDILNIRMFITSSDIETDNYLIDKNIREQSQFYSGDSLEECFSIPSKIMASGGSTGKPKLIVSEFPAGNSDDSLRDWFRMSGQNFNQIQLLCGPLYHGAPNGAAYAGLFAGNTLIIPVRFNVSQVVRLVEKYKVEHMQLVPTMMVRIIKLEGLRKEQLSSLKAIVHTGSYCGDWIKEKWIELIGPEKVFEIYSMTEMIGMTTITGVEWLEHRGSIGRPFGRCKISIRDENGNELGPNVVGEIFMKSFVDKLPTRYIGHAQLNPTEDGFYSVGDMGYVDEDNYLYFCDRRFDLIITGGENVYAAEVQNVLIKYDGIDDAAVIGIPSIRWGKKIHAIIQSKISIDFKELDKYMKAHLLPYKVPKSYEQIKMLPRGENGKLNLKQLLEERIS